MFVFVPVRCCSCINPGNAAMLARAGWSKRDVKEFIFEIARHPHELAKLQGARFVRANATGAFWGLIGGMLTVAAVAWWNGPSPS